MVGGYVITLCVSYWSGPHLEPLHQPFFVMGFFKFIQALESYLPRDDFEVRSS
jgi:hypothetical protein